MGTLMNHRVIDGVVVAQGDPALRSPEELRAVERARAEEIRDARRLTDEELQGAIQQLTDEIAALEAQQRTADAESGRLRRLLGLPAHSALAVIEDRAPLTRRLAVLHGVRRERVEQGRRQGRWSRIEKVLRAADGLLAAIAELDGFDDVTRWETGFREDRLWSDFVGHLTRRREVAERWHRNHLAERQPEPPRARTRRVRFTARAASADGLHLYLAHDVADVPRGEAEYFVKQQAAEYVNAR